MVRQDVHFTSHGETLAAWLYPAEGGGADGAGPAIVLGHGLGCSKELGMDKYCEEFSRVGYTCLAFDYRNFGGSTGKPRGHINTTKQVEDFHAAIAYIRSLPQVAPERVGIFGSSFGGGNVIQVASQDPRLKATISQCPFTNGLLSTSKVGIAVAPFVAARALRDFMWGSNDDPVTISLIGEPGSGEPVSPIVDQQGLTVFLPCPPSGADEPPRRRRWLQESHSGRIQSPSQCPR